MVPADNWFGHRICTCRHGTPAGLALSGDVLRLCAEVHHGLKQKYTRAFMPCIALPRYVRYSFVWRHIVVLRGGLEPLHVPGRGEAGLSLHLGCIEAEVAFALRSVSDLLSDPKRAKVAASIARKVWGLEERIYTCTCCLLHVAVSLTHYTFLFAACSGNCVRAHYAHVTHSADMHFVHTFSSVF